ncbi:MAG: hypothetical protein AB1894_01355 [Chloroflexota bacterium]
MKHRIQIGVVLLAILLVSLACNFSVSTASIKDAYLAADTDGKERQTVFSQDSVFYCIVELGSAPDDTRVKAAWTAVAVEGEQSERNLGEKELTSGSGQLSFNLSNSSLWPAGKYKVDVYLDDKLERTLEFEVEGSQAAQPTQAPAPTQSSPASITHAILARDPEGNETAVIFAPSDVIYCVLDLEAPAGAKVKASWSAVQAENTAPNTLIDEVENDLTSGTYHFNLTPDSQWPAGQYRVDLYVNGGYVQSLDYEVQGVSPAGTTITRATMAFDADGNSPTTVFSPTDIFYCVVELEGADEVAVRAAWTAVDAQGIEPNAPIDEVEGQLASGSYHFSLTPENQWPTGLYRVELYVNGVFFQALDFEVR